jgi:chemosensory pili system protein ChpA (sensor histidine kinase/response regulator)
MDLRRTLVDKVNDTDALLLQQSRIQGELQEGLMNARLVPFSRMVPRLQRVVRQVANEVGKAAELVINNAEGELDRTILDRIVAPLEHMLRNAVDHGLELPEQRRAAGKPEQGHISLTISREGNEIVLILQDDGRGIDVEAVRRKAIERKILTEASVVTDHEIQQLIFHAGLSTAQKITQISGRGVGMDVVRSNVRKLNGRVGVRSTVGKGSIFTIKLPLTLAIIDALLVKSGNQVFALPGTAVEETLIVPPESVSHLTSRQAINLRGEVLGVCRLKHLLKSASPDSADESDGLSVVVVSAAGRRMGIIVDTFVRRQEVVIKPLAPYLASLPGISGASIMGDGGVVLILDPAELLQLAVQETV